jgi:hypothetical protein
VDPSVLRFAQMAAIFVSMCGALAVGMLAFGVGARLLKRMSSAPTPPLEDRRLERLEQAVDTIALEVERISESQRFIAKLLDERSPESARLRP